MKAEDTEISDRCSANPALHRNSKTRECRNSPTQRSRCRERQRRKEKRMNNAMEVTPKELKCMMQQAVLSRDAEDLSGFVTMFDESGNLCRQYDDGHSERIEVSGN